MLVKKEKYRNAVQSPTALYGPSWFVTFTGISFTAGTKT